LGKISEQFVGNHFNDLFADHLDCNQFGCTSRSATEALLRTRRDLFLVSNKPGNIAKLLFVDLKRALVLTDHNVLMDNFCFFQFP
jgi:hypothetical protein